MGCWQAATWQQLCGPLHCFNLLVYTSYLLILGVGWIFFVSRQGLYFIGQACPKLLAFLPVQSRGFMLSSIKSHHSEFFLSFFLNSFFLSSAQARTRSLACSGQVLRVWATPQLWTRFYTTGGATLQGGTSRTLIWVTIQKVVASVASDPFALLINYDFCRLVRKRILNKNGWQAGQYSLVLAAEGWDRVWRTHTIYAEIHARTSHFIVSST